MPALQIAACVCEETGSAGEGRRAHADTGKGTPTLGLGYSNRESRHPDSVAAASSTALAASSVDPSSSRSVSPCLPTGRRRSMMSTRMTGLLDHCTSAGSVK